jgi:hypothetical protein
MPLRDHFRPPLNRRSAWESIHAMWPALISLELNRKLPPDYVAEPRVRLGTFFEIDLGTSERLSDGLARDWVSPPGTMATLARPAVDVEADFVEPAEYEVLIYHQDEERKLVAAIEFVSPANKDRILTRRAFVGKCFSLLQQGVSVSIVDFVTARQFNLYIDLLDFIGQVDPTLAMPVPSTYSATLRHFSFGLEPKRLRTWSNVLSVGAPIPPLLVWLNEENWFEVDLEGSYMQTCQALRIEGF